MMFWRCKKQFWFQSLQLMLLHVTVCDILLILSHYLYTNICCLVCLPIWNSLLFYYVLWAVLDMLRLNLPSIACHWHISYICFWICVSIIHKPMNLLHGLLCRLSLFWRYLIKYRHHSTIQSSCIIQKQPTTDCAYLVPFFSKEGVSSGFCAYWRYLLFVQLIGSCLCSENSGCICCLYSRRLSAFCTYRVMLMST